MGTLVLIRHAKAEPAHSDDHSRALSARGRLDAAAVGDWLRQRHLRADRVVVSTALRTQQTWELASPEGPAPILDPGLYENTVAHLREVVRVTDAEVETLVLVGHNPSMERLAWELDPSPQARSHTDVGLPTGAVAVFAVESWAEPEAAVLRELVVPRG